MHKDCIFCKIATKEIPVNAVYEDESIIAFPDINKAAPVHILLIPKKHIANILEITPEDSPLLSNILAAVPKIAQMAGLAENGFRLVANTKSDGGQTVHHLHFHILGGRELSWPPG